MATFTNLLGSSVSTGATDTETGIRYLAATRRYDGDYEYHSPITGRAYIVSAEDIDYLGHLVSAIASDDAEMLADDERVEYRSKDHEHSLCELTDAYAIWCGATSCKEIEVTP